MTDINRIKQLAGLREDFDVTDDEAKLKDYDAQDAREKVIKQQIAQGFKALGISITRIDYDEYPSRSAMVVLDDEPLGWSIEQLAGLANLEFVSDMKILAYKNNLEVHFTVK